MRRWYSPAVAPFPNFVDTIVYDMGFARTGMEDVALQRVKHLCENASSCGLSRKVLESAEQ